MDFIKKIADQADGNQGQQPHADQKTQQSGSGGILDKLNGLAGGGPEGEKKEDTLDKGIDWVQENVFKQGAQNDESAAEQAKDSMIAKQIREQYKNATGKDFPLKEKENKEQEAKGSGLGGLGGLFK
ncbi:hypothetical protein C8A01DRAFT_38525 [Parachaetomium inaequale]|uniref:Uncharacterized protein n=1 Tax=Parachaetomium inaequale TaxID=2588326 RepID=A0AAN6PB02_9PEZI|nr:hypothetical protein C8A01DRAFT_38525 [Parachaetomium inaequale]